jgi:hypothetical protein
LGYWRPSLVRSDKRENLLNCHSERSEESVFPPLPVSHFEKGEIERDLENKKGEHLMLPLYKNP